MSSIFWIIFLTGRTQIYYLSNSFKKVEYCFGKYSLFQFFGIAGCGVLYNEYGLAALIK